MNSFINIIKNIFEEKQKNPIKPKLCVLDLDDVTYEFLGYLCFLFNSIHYTSVNPNDINSWEIDNIQIQDPSGRIINGKEITDLMRRFEAHGLYAAMPLIYGADQAIRNMVAHGCEIAFITARPERCGEDTYLNLLTHKIPFSHLIFSWDKAKVINDLSERYDIRLFVDDKLETVNIVAEKCNVGTVCLMNKAHNKDRETNSIVKKVDSLMECIKYVK